MTHEAFIRDATTRDIPALLPLLEDLFAVLEDLFAVERDFAFDASRARAGLESLISGAGDVLVWRTTTAASWRWDRSRR